jgi:CTP:molybdopterin cytidylyltransferase MocA
MGAARAEDTALQERGAQGYLMSLGDTPAVVSADVTSLHRVVGSQAISYQSIVLAFHSATAWLLESYLKQRIASRDMR